MKPLVFFSSRTLHDSRVHMKPHAMVTYVHSCTENFTRVADAGCCKRPDRVCGCVGVPTQADADGPGHGAPDA